MSKSTLQTKHAPKAIGPYAQAVKKAGILFTSGQLGIDVETGVLAEGVEAQAHCAMRNLLAILATAPMDLSYVNKTPVFLKDLTDFTVVNKVYASYFEQDFPARSCVQVAALPLGGLVEIECVAIE